MKRKDEEPGGVSPPPTKRKIESTTTGKAVANFFKPASEKEPERLTWRVIDESLLIGRYRTAETEHTAKRRKIAAFDFDSTLVSTVSGNIFSKDATDWKWWDHSVPSKLKSLYAAGYEIAIVSNQGGMSMKSNSKTAKADLKRYTIFCSKASLVLNQLDLPIRLLAATRVDQYRKPRTGMWRELLDELDLDEGEGPDLENSFFVGDAAGRIATKHRKADFSCSDRDMAANIGLKFMTPEEYFLGQPPLEWRRPFDPLTYAATQTIQSKSNYSFSSNVEIILMCGSPGSGKSTFYFTILKPLGYERINQDILRSRDKCLKVAAEYLSDKKPVVVDNTNATEDVRSKWVALARASNVPIRCVWLETPPEVCRHNDMVRGLNEGFFNPEQRSLLPGVAFADFVRRFKQPDLQEGFEDIIRVPFVFEGDAKEREIWTKYWV